MLKESLEVFKEQLDKHGDKLILDNYTPADGTYLIIGTDKDEFYIKDEPIEVKFDKKNRKLNLSEVKLKDIRIYDYNSTLITMNKPIDGKKIIHSNNYLSFFIKKDKFPTANDKDKKLTNEIIDGYYEILANPYLKYKSGKPKEIYKEVEEEIGEVNIELLNKIKEWIKENIFDLGSEYPGKDYLKIFFEYPIEDYQRENKRYIIPNIYNKNDYNEKIDNVLYGLPNDNMGLNSKKPYLENKTRKVKVPYLIDSNEVLLQKKFFDYLMNFTAEGKLNVYIDDEEIDPKKNGELPDQGFTGSFFRIKKGMELEIQNYDKIVGYSDVLNKELVFENVLGVKESADDGFEYGSFRKKVDIQKILDNIFFSKFLINNYFTDAGDISIKDNNQKKNLLISREAIFNWLYKDGLKENKKSNEIGYLLGKVSLSLVKGSIENGYIPKASKQFNLRCAFKRYFEGGKSMADIIKDVKDNLRNKVNAEKVTESISEDNEYYFAIGQLVSYFISKSKGLKRPYHLVRPFINTNNNEVIKNNLSKLYKKYSYDPKLYSLRFRNLYAMVLSYTPENKVNQDMIMAGFLHSSLIYESNEDEIIENMEVQGNE